MYFALPESYMGYTHAEILQYRVMDLGEGGTPTYVLELRLGNVEDDGNGGEQFVSAKLRPTDSVHLGHDMPLPVPAAYLDEATEIPAPQILARYAYAAWVRKWNLGLLIPEDWNIPADWAQAA